MPDVASPPLKDEAGPPSSPPAAKTRYDAWAYVIIGVLGLPLLALLIGALFLPPGVAIALIRRGIAQGRPHWIVFGALAGAVWLLLLWSLGRRLMRPRKAEEEPDEAAK